ncbi:MAG TPA: hypothetical protein VGZ50_04960 [Actinomycetota bacterium]|nr:hypothetical protein [Actinomycetota bacterium]
MTRSRRDIDARRGRRVRTRLTRVLALAVAGPVVMGSLAYAAGVGPVRRRVDEFFKGTAQLLHKADSSTDNFHLSPNPVGRGVLVMPVDDRGPRPAAGDNLEEDRVKTKKEKASSSPSRSKKQSEPTSTKGNNVSSSRGSKEGKSETNPDGSKAADSDSALASNDRPEEDSEHDSDGSKGDHSGDDSSGSDDDSGEEDSGSGSDSGSDGSGEDDSGSGSSGSDSDSDED